MNIEIGTEAAQFQEKEYVNGNFLAVYEMALAIEKKVLLYFILRLPNPTILENDLPRMAKSRKMTYWGWQIPAYDGSCEIVTLKRFKPVLKPDFMVHGIMESQIWTL
jgi:hypothetical protein